jgi:hypothetical protein
LLRNAAEITSREVRTLYAIHLSTALYFEADSSSPTIGASLGAEAQGVAAAAPGIN